MVWCKDQHKERDQKGIGFIGLKVCCRYCGSITYKINAMPDYSWKATELFTSNIVWLLCTVHFGGGFWGVLSVPIFNTESGIFYVGSEHSFCLFGWNLLGVLAIMAWSAALSFPMFFMLRTSKQLRVSAEIEQKGNILDQIHKYINYSKEFHA